MDENDLKKVRVFSRKIIDRLKLRKIRTVLDLHPVIGVLTIKVCHMRDTKPRYQRKAFGPAIARMDEDEMDKLVEVYVKDISSYFGVVETVDV